MSYLLETGLALAFFYGAYWLLLKKETYFHLNRIYLISALILSFVVPALRLTSPFLTAPAPEEFIGSILPAPPSPSISWGGVLLGVYLTGVLACLLRLGAHLARLAVIVRRCGVRRAGGFKVVVIPEDFAPFSFLGFIFINVNALVETDLRRILAHERVHVRQLHSFDVLLMELVIAFQWFNPFVWPYKKSLQETHEYLADAGVIAQGFSPVTYQLLLFEQHVGAKLFEFANNFKQSQIKRRILMLSKIQSGGAAKLKLLLVLPLAVVLALAFADPRPARSAQQADADAHKDKVVLKQKVEQAVQELGTLKEKEAMLRSKIEETSDPELKKELKTKLSEVLKKEEQIISFLNDNGALPPPAPMNPEKQMQILMEKEAKLRTMLEAETDAAKKTELKKNLENVLAKQADLKAHNGNGGGPLKPGEEVTIEGLKKEYSMLKQKEEDVRTQLASTQDAKKKAELENLLQKILQKQESVKAKAESLKTAK